MVGWLRPQYILAFITSLYYCSHLVTSKTYDKFWCATEEGQHQISCPDENSLLTDISIQKVYRRTEMCAPDHHSELLLHCQSYADGSVCEGNKTCSIEISTRDYIQCEEKSYMPTYFYVKYTCTQIHEMCTNQETIRNTLYGYIISPYYPHPMADHLKCSITIEADPSMFIELYPIQIHLQDAIKCRTEYIQILAYNPFFDEKKSEQNSDWKSYHTWCGADHSMNNPLPNARYLIPSNSLYISLSTMNSMKPRYFKIRYKVIPASARSQYNVDGIAFESPSKEKVYAGMRSPSDTSVLTTTIVIPSLNNSDVKHVNGTLIKRRFRKEILIGIIAGVVALLILISVGMLVFILLKRRRSSPTSSASKKSTPSPASHTASKPIAKSSDKAPLLEQTNNTAAAAIKRKLVPERTVQISDASSSRFKAGESAGPKAGSTKPESSASKPTLTAADSGIYGADLSEETSSAPKPISSPPPPPPSSLSDAPKTHEADVSDVTEVLPTVIVNPLNEDSTIAAIVPSNNIEPNSISTIANEEKQTLLDSTVQSAYPNLIDATTSENEGTLCGSESGSRRSLDIIQTLANQDSTSLETVVISEYPESSLLHTIPFNPLHVILKKDANKYYTTEYI